MKVSKLAYPMIAGATMACTTARPYKTILIEDGTVECRYEQKTPDWIKVTAKRAGTSVSAEYNMTARESEPMWRMRDIEEMTDTKDSNKAFERMMLLLQCIENGQKPAHTGSGTNE